MGMNEQDYVDYWEEVRGKIDKFRKIPIIKSSKKQENFLWVN